MKLQSLVMVALSSLLLTSCTTSSLSKRAKTLSKIGASIYAPPHYADDTFAFRLKDLKQEDAVTGNNRGFFYDYLLQINQNYAKYLSALTAGRAATNLAFDTLTLGLSGAATMFTPLSTKTILSGLSTFFQGERQSVDKSFFDEKAVFALSAIMEIRRSQVLQVMRKNLATTTYTLGDALLDLEDFYRAGTLHMALQAAYVNQPATPTVTDKADSPRLPASTSPQ